MQAWLDVGCECTDPLQVSDHCLPPLSGGAPSGAGGVPRWCWWIQSPIFTVRMIRRHNLIAPSHLISQICQTPVVDEVGSRRVTGCAGTTLSDMSQVASFVMLRGASLLQSEHYATNHAWPTIVTSRHPSPRTHSDRAAFINYSNPHQPHWSRTAQKFKSNTCMFRAQAGVQGLPFICKYSQLLWYCEEQQKKK